MTKSHFLYYAEGAPYAPCLSRPLAVIPLDMIQSVKRVCVEVPERSEKLATLKNFQFELFLKPMDRSFSQSLRNEEQSYPSPLKFKKKVPPVIIKEVSPDKENGSNRKPKHDKENGHSP